MTDNNYYMTLASFADVAALTTFTAVDVTDLEGVCEAVLINAIPGVGETLDVKLQESANNSSWSDITGGAFTQQTHASTGAPTRIKFNINPIKQYVRAVIEPSSGDTITAGVILVGSKKYS